MVNSVESGSQVQQATAVFRQATQSTGAATEPEPVKSPIETQASTQNTSPVQHNTGLKGEKPEDTDTERGAYLDVTV